MELKNFTDVGVDVTEVDESIDFSIDQESLGVLFKGFSDGLYSNKIGSIVREITSNCFDSHIEAAITRPVTIEMTSPDGYTGTPGSISFIDYGVGLSPERMRNIYSKYFASTKRTTNDQIGGFGIGAKSPLSYIDSFTAITRFEGIEYVYIIHRGVKVPQVQLVEKNPTDKHNGTEIKIPIKNKNDFNDFQREIHNQLAFFDNINYINCGMDNNYKLYQGKHFIVRCDNSVSDDRLEPSICLGKVKYPIDWNQVKNLNRYEFDSPIALRFDIGELTVTMNRESIEYTDKVKAAINQKFIDAAAELQKLSDSTTETVDDFSVYMELVKNDTPVLKLDKDVFINVKGFIKPRPAQYKEFLKFPPSFTFPRNNPFFQYEVPGFIDFTGTMKSQENSRRRYSSVKGIKELIDKKYKIFRVAGTAGKRKNLYLHSIHGDFYVVRKATDPPDIDRLLFSVVTDSAVAKEVCEIYSQVVLKYLLAHSESYDKTPVDDAWLTTYIADLRNHTEVRDRTLIFYREYAGVSRYDRTFESNKMKYSDFVKRLKHNQVIVYGNIEESDKLETFGKIIARQKNLSTKDSINKKAIRILKISKENIKIVSQLPGAISIDQAFVRFHKHITRCKLRDDLRAVFKSGGVYDHVIEPCFPRIKKICREIAEESVEKVFSAVSEYPTEVVDNIIATSGPHPSLAHLFTEVKKVEAWYNAMPLLDFIEGHDISREDEEDQKPLYDAIKKYARQNVKSILNY
jgi:hypothetical protein